MNTHQLVSSLFLSFHPVSRIDHVQVSRAYGGHVLGHAPCRLMRHWRRYNFYGIDIDLGLGIGLKTQNLVPQHLQTE